MRMSGPRLSYLFWFLGLCCFGLCVMPAFSSALSSEEEIRVQLPTESTRLLIVVEPIEGSHSEFDASYLQALRSVLTFDLDHNGFTEVLSASRKNRALLQKLRAQEGFDLACDFGVYGDSGIYYVIKAKVENKNLATKVISINGQSAKLIEGVSLCGELSKDRRAIHCLSDSICQMLFQKPGIASSRILFTERRRVQPSGKGESAVEIGIRSNWSAV